MIFAVCVSRLRYLLCAYRWPVTWQGFVRPLSGNGSSDRIDNPPTRTVMAALTPEMTAVADNAGILAAFRAFLVAQEILSVQDCGLFAATEPDIAKEIVDVAAAGGVHFEWKDKVSVKKLWLVCRKAVDEGSGRKKESPSEPDASLTEEDVKEIKGLWSKVHGFVIPEFGYWRLVCAVASLAT